MNPTLRLDDPLIGMPVYGGFVIERRLGEGGMGAVYAAVDRELDKRIAVKVLLPIHSSNGDVLARFLGEAKAASRIGHDNIVRIDAKGTLPDGRAYVAMEYLEGQGLDAYLAAHGRLAPPHALAILVQIAAALEAAHVRSIVHRDIKPPNIFVTRKPGQPIWIKVLDFGIARFLDPSHTRGISTREGVVIGTPSYMPPEQAVGAATVDQRADIYALGVLAHVMLAGRLPEHDGVEPAPPPGPWSDAIRWALRFHPADRPAHVIEWVRTLAAATPDGAAIAAACAPGLLDGERAAPPPAGPARALASVPTTLGSAVGAITATGGPPARRVWLGAAAVAAVVFGSLLAWRAATTAGGPDRSGLDPAAAMSPDASGVESDGTRPGATLPGPSAHGHLDAGAETPSGPGQVDAGRDPRVTGVHDAGGDAPGAGDAETIDATGDRATPSRRLPSPALDDPRPRRRSAPSVAPPSDRRSTQPSPTHSPRTDPRGAIPKAPDDIVD